MTTEHPSAEGAQEKVSPLWHAGTIEHWARDDRGLRGQQLREAAAELRRLHARVQELERAVAHAEMAAETEARYSDERCAKAAADEREACAQVAMRVATNGIETSAAIRARGAQGESNDN